ncbi:MAG TPA: hypothetical protein DHV30_10975 [Balneola sp.]|nr:hypothetical protein [Balneola sp.]
MFTNDKYSENNVVSETRLTKVLFFMNRLRGTGNYLRSKGTKEVGTMNARTVDYRISKKRIFNFEIKNLEVEYWNLIFEFQLCFNNTS